MPRDRRDAPASPAITIGAVSRATDIPANTIRTWERRYGFPVAARTEGNQRLYDPDVVPHLRLVAHALALGHRPRQILALAPEQLRSLLGRTAAAPVVPSSGEPVAAPVVPSSGEPVAGWIRAARDLDGDALELGFRAEWARLGGVPFLVQRAAPFLVQVGERWAAGELTVYQEHAASQRLRDFLTAIWRPLADRASGPPVVCATLPGEQHDLGLQMAATVAALASRRVAYLGPDTPIDELAACADRHRATAVLVSVAAGKAADLVAGHLGALRERLDPRLALIVGGAGAVAVPGAQVLDALPPLADRLR